MTLRVMLLRAVVAALAVGVQAQTVVYVDANADQEPHDGLDWCHAYLELHEALAVAGPDTIIRVADGTYSPDPTGLADPREAAFVLLDGVTLEGGYAGCGAADPDERDIELFETVLSGDLAGDDLADLAAALPCYSGEGTFPAYGCESYDLDEDNDVDCADFGTCDNSYHVATSSGASATTVLDGFTLTHGFADGPWSGEEAYYQGGGLHNLDGSPTLIDCIFAVNLAESGGGMYSTGESSPMLTRCGFSENLAARVGTGGGMCSVFGNATLIDCTFSSNNATGNGGGMSILGDATLSGCTFSENATLYSSGGGLDSYGNPMLTDCTFNSNSAFEIAGGGMYSFGDPSLTRMHVQWKRGVLWRRAVQPRRRGLG